MNVHGCVVWLEAELLACALIYVPSLCMHAVKVLASLRDCESSSEPSLVVYAINVKSPCTRSYIFETHLLTKCALQSIILHFNRIKYKQHSLLMRFPNAHTQYCVSLYNTFWMKT